jgi:large subunit ribosomal protein L19
MNEAIALIEKKHLKETIPACEVGQTVKVKIRVTELDKNKKATTRIQTFEGVVISRTGSGINETITVRRITYQIGVERSFPLHAPIVDDVEVVRSGKVRRARLYYLRDRVGKRARLREKARAPRGTAPKKGQRG